MDFPRRHFSPRAEKSRRTSAIRIPIFMTGSSINHLGIAVRSIDRALEFYRDQLGLSVSLRESVEIEKVHAAMLPVGASRIELLEA
ncbi:MAG TPA: VOC family protein, partial [Bryobacteraceae bacterium]